MYLSVLATTTMSNAVMNLSSLPLLRRRQSMHEAPPAHSSSSSVFHRLDFLLAEPPRFTYSATLQVRPQQTEAIRQLLLTNQSSLTERYLRLFPNDSIPIRQHVQEWRKYVYDRSLYALPLPDVTGRFRECSAAFYR